MNFFIDDFGLYADEDLVEEPVEHGWGDDPYAHHHFYFDLGYDIELPLGSSLNMPGIADTAQQSVMQQVIHDAAQIATARAPIIASVADSVQPGSGSLVRSTAEGLTSAARVANALRVRELGLDW